MFKILRDNKNNKGELVKAHADVKAAMQQLSNLHSLGYHVVIACDTDEEENELYAKYGDVLYPPR